MRLFAAIIPTTEWLDELKILQRSLQRQYPVGVRWTSPESLHMTVQFIGDLEATLVESVVAIWSRLAITFPTPLILEPDRCGSFPKYGPERVLWAGIQVRQGSWFQLVERVQEVLADLNFYYANTIDDAPHITLGRVRHAHAVRGIRDVLRTLSIVAPPMAVKEVELLSSESTTDGVRYRRRGVAKVIVGESGIQ